MTDEPSIPVLAKSEQTLYARCLKQIHEDLKLIQKTFARFARNMATIRDQRLYFAGGYATFEQFCQKEIGKSRQQVYRIIAAHDVLQHLLKQGVSEADLPDTERLCREIKALPLDAQASVWKAVLRVKREEGRAPTIVDVQDAAVEIVKTDDTLERQQGEMIKRIESLGRGLKVGLPFESLTPSFRRRLTVALTDIAETVQTLIHALRSPAIAERVEASKKSDQEHKAPRTTR